MSQKERLSQHPKLTEPPSTNNAAYFQFSQNIHFPCIQAPRAARVPDLQVKNFPFLRLVFRRLQPLTSMSLSSSLVNFRSFDRTYTITMRSLSQLILPIRTTCAFVCALF